MSKYQKYPEYKDSYTPWLGNVPEHWTSIKFKQAFIHKTKTSNSKLDCGSISFGNVVYKDNEKIPEETRAAYQEVLAGEFLINPLNLNFDLKSLRTALSTLNVAVSTGYIVLQSKPNLNKNYLRWLLFQFDVAHMKTLGAGVRQTVSFTDIGNEYFQMPPFQEQQTIANYLDKATAKIDTLIEKQTKLIELLKEKRQAVISTAVTSGLDSSVPMKDSGVEWLGEIPEHWNLCSLGYVSNIDCGSTPSRDEPAYWKGNIPWIKTGEVKYSKINNAEEYITEEGLKNSSLKIANKGTMLMAMYGQGVTRGRVAILGIEATYNQACAAITFSSKIFNEYAQYFFVAAYSFIRDFGNETSQMNLNASIIEKIKILTPLADEQQEIVNYLDNKTSRIDNLITKSTKAIELLKEKRTALISSVVTGKIDVREIA